MKESYTTRLDPNLREQLETIALNDKRTLSSLIHKVLADFVVMEVNNQAVLRSRAFRKANQS